MGQHNYRLTRGAKADYADMTYQHEATRDAAAQRYAILDDEPVMCFDLATEDGKTDWWLVDSKYPPGHPELDQLEAARQDPNRVSASTLMPGDTATIFGARAGTWPQANSNHEGTIVNRESISLPTTVIPGIRFTFDDGRQIDCIDHAIATLRRVGTDWDDALRELLG